MILRKAPVAVLNLRNSCVGVLHLGVYTHHFPESYSQFSAMFTMASDLALEILTLLVSASAKETCEMTMSW